MKNKKLLSTVVAATLVASTMAMPVMAANGGEFNIDVSTRTGIIRVQVPTSMLMAVDQFEIVHTGSQIAAGEFEMTNMSEMDVKVGITSTATLGTDISLASTAAGIDATKDEAWLGVAAMTNDGSTNSGKNYDDPETADTTEEFWELTDANSNVTTFAADTKKAEQIFYLAKGTGAATYKLAVPSDTTAGAGYKKETYAQYYKLEENTSITDDATLRTAVGNGDVYAVASGDIGKHDSGVTKIDGNNISTTTYANTNKYYRAADTASDPTGSDIYVYGVMGTAGGKAGFTYVGKLSSHKESWSDADISQVNVKYEIGGVTGTRYDEVDDYCTYGLYKEPSVPDSAPDIATKTYTMTANTPIEIEVDLGEGESAATGVSSIMDPTGAFDYLSNAQYATYDADAKKITLTAAMVNACMGGNVSSVKVIFNDSEATEISVTLAM